MKRIAAVDVKRAYEATGTRPVRRRWYRRYDQSACPLSALAIEATASEELGKLVDEQGFSFDDDSSVIGLIASKLGVTESYVKGFVIGVDFANPKTVMPFDFEHTKMDEWNAGLEDGLLVRQSLGTTLAGMP